MTLINRVSRLFQADLHAVLDRVEEPDLLLRHAVREMEEHLARDRRRLELMTEERRSLGTRVGELESSLAGAQEELDVCFGAGNEDLARTLIRHRLESGRLRDFLVTKRDTLERDLTSLQGRISGNSARLEAMRQKAELLAGEESSGKPDDDCWKTPDFHVRDDEVEVAFLRERQRRVSK